VGGVILTCPLWLFQIWQFVAPALYSHEKKYGVIFIAAGTVLFAIGVSFAYFLVLPAAFEFLFSFGGGKDKPMITINDYFSFFTSTMMVFGFAFELPLVIVVLGAFGIVDQHFLREKRRIMIVVLSVISAVVTPPDAASMLMLLIPLLVLYEISIILVGVVAAARIKRLS
jgi:sec-independent protein translocase protein TatC